jgi:hypothetical protein
VSHKDGTVIDRYNRENHARVAAEARVAELERDLTEAREVAVRNAHDASHLRHTAIDLEARLARVADLAPAWEQQAEVHLRTLRDGVRQGGLGDGMMRCARELRAALSPPCPMHGDECGQLSPYEHDVTATATASAAKDVES